MTREMVSHLRRYVFKLIIGPGGMCPFPCSTHATGLAKISISGASFPDVVSPIEGFSDGGKSPGSVERINATDSPIYPQR